MDEIITTWNKHEVRYLLIGAQAVRLYGMPRFSYDWDIFIPPRDDANFKKLNALMEEDLDMPVLPLGSRGENFIQTYQTKYGLLQFHLAGPGFPPFDAAEHDSRTLKLESGTMVKCVSAETLLAMKEASNRSSDQSDILYLRSILDDGPKS
jgi:hypothetical protein